MNDISGALPRSTRRVLEAARAMGLEADMVEMPESTRTAADAAAACGCGIAQIVKSLVFRGKQSGKPYLLLVSGVNRVDEEKAGHVIGEPLVRADASFVRSVTGYAIGGVPPFGHDRPLMVFMDPDLLKFDEIWAAAGTPRTVARLDPRALRDCTRARVVPVS